MSMSQSIRKATIGVAAIGALALGGSALAGAATSTTSTTGTTPSAAAPGGAPPAGAPAQRPDPTKPGGHVGANGRTEQPLSSSDAAKVKAAAEAKVPGGTVERVETDVDHGSPFEAHVTKSDGTQLEVLVNSNYEVTAVNTMQHP